MDPTSVNPVNAIDKAQQVKDTQEELDRAKQQQMDDVEDLYGMP